MAKKKPPAPKPNAVAADPGQLQTLAPAAGKLRVIPLGGLGQFGMNCALLECEGEMVLIDCGQMMPDEDMLGVDYVIPDLQFVENHKDRLKGILITHTHEDHIGALPYVLPKFPPDLRVFASPFAAAIIREKLREHRLDPVIEIIEPREVYRISDKFSVEPISVTHSTIDCYALAIRTPAGVVIHSGDFKIDPSPPDGIAFDHYAFARYNEESDDGVLLLMSDSTNVDRKGSCPSEADTIIPLRHLMSRAEGAIIFSCFASSIHRIQTVLDLAAEMGRTVYGAGLNMERNIRVASELERLEIRGDYRDDLKGAMATPRRKRLVLTTGSQGEPLSGLSRMAHGNHKFVMVEPGDMVILSARMIPGNEKKIYRLGNALARRGAQVYDERSAPGIHVSGHAYRDDMKHLINLVQPRFFVPVHGEYRMLDAHRRLALELGLEDDDAILIENGDVLELTKNSARVLGKVPHGHVLVDGKGVGDVGEVVLRDRHYLSQDGMVICTIAVDAESGEILQGPDVVTRGVIHEDENAQLLEDARRAVLDALKQLSDNEMEDKGVVAAEVKKALRQFFKRRMERFPVIFPMVLEV